MKTRTVNQVDLARDCLAVRRMLTLADDDRRIDARALRTHFSDCSRCAAESPELALMMSTRPSDPLRAPVAKSLLKRPRRGAATVMTSVCLLAAIFLFVAQEEHQPTGRSFDSPAASIRGRELGLPSGAATSGILVFDRDRVRETTAGSGDASPTTGRRAFSWENE